MKLLLLFVGWCVLVLLCWVAALALALLYSAGAGLARCPGVCRRLLNGRNAEKRGVPLA